MHLQLLAFHNRSIHVAPYASFLGYVCTGMLSMGSNTCKSHSHTPKKVFIHPPHPSGRVATDAFALDLRVAYLYAGHLLAVGPDSSSST